MSKFWVSINFLLFFSIQHHFANSLPNSTAIGGGRPIWAKKQQQLRPKGKGPSSRENRVLANKDNVILDQLLKNYDQRIRPPKLFGKNETAVRVSVNILIRMLSKIDVVNMEYSLQITFREQWVDGRLAYRDMGLPNLPKFLTVPHVKAKIWFPDTFFPTEKNAHRHMLDTENMFVRIYPDGTVLYSSRLSLVCSCPMHLQLYPLDVQYCDFDLISYAHTTTDIVYEWASTEPVQLKAGVGQDLPNFHLDPVIDTGIECTSHTNTGTYACLRMRMRLSRLMTYFVLQLYIPTSLVVCVSLVSFWIDMHSTAGRVALAIMTLLTITTMQSSINAKLPPVNYVKVVDVWLGACQAFVFSALIEYAVVCYRDSALRNSQRRETEMRLAQRRKSIAAGGLTIDDGPFDAKLPPPPEQQWLDWATGERSALPEDEDNLPCTCELGGIGSAVLATLGMVPLSGNVISTSLLLPIAATAENSKVRRRSIGRRNGAGGGMHQQKHAQFQVLELKKQRRPFWTWLKKKLRKPDYLPARIDYYARIWMPIGFLVFNCAYWTICLIMASQQQMRGKN